jgi:hypothetical protein
MAGESREAFLFDRRRRNRPETLRQKNGMFTMRIQRISKGSGE